MNEFPIQQSGSFDRTARALHLPEFDQPNEWKSFRFFDGIRIDFQPLEGGRWKTEILTGANTWLHEIEDVQPTRETAIALYHQYIVNPVKAKLAHQAERRDQIAKLPQFDKGDLVMGSTQLRSGMWVDFSAEVLTVQRYGDDGGNFELDLRLIEAIGVGWMPGDHLTYYSTAPGSIRYWSDPEPGGFSYRKDGDQFVVWDDRADAPVMIPLTCEVVLAGDSESVIARIVNRANAWGKLHWFEHSAQFKRLLVQNGEVISNEIIQISFESPIAFNTVQADDNEMIEWIEGLAFDALSRTHWGEPGHYSTPILESLHPLNPA